MRLDFGCGPNKKDGFTGVDQYPFDGAVDVVMDINNDVWPWEESSIEEAHASHFVDNQSKSPPVETQNQDVPNLVAAGRRIARGKNSRFVLNSERMRMVQDVRHANDRQQLTTQSKDFRVKRTLDPLW